jgi:hypothetical protein
MGGGLLQLVAYGAQDVYLTGNPQITFWKVSYRRYTNFSMEAISQTFSGTPRLGNRVSCQISRNGDLVHKMYIEVTSIALAAAINVADGGAYMLINNVEVEIGGQKIDKQFGEWMFIWNKLSLPAGKYAGLEKVTGIRAADFAVNPGTRTVIVPLEFWFCRNPGLALPLIALQYHEVKINVQFSTGAQIQFGGATPYDIGTATLWVDYIFLDTDERRRMAQNPHEYLIDQVQFTGEEALTGTTQSIRLNFNHPVKELVWVGQIANADTARRVFRYNQFDTATLQLNGQDRFAARTGAYFSQVQPFQHHSNVPTDADVNTVGFTVQGTVTSNINVYSFALRPEEHQPSGTCNFSRIDSAILKLTYGTVAAAALTRLRVYAVNYNVLRVMSGMGGLAYSN